MSTKVSPRSYRSSQPVIMIMFLDLPAIRPATAAPRVGEVHDRARKRRLGGLVLPYGSKVCSKAAPVIIPEPYKE